MKRVLTLALAVGLSLGTLTAAVPAQAKNPECRGPKLAGAEGTPKQVKRTIWCVANKLPHVTARKAVAIARRETGLGADEYNNYSGACGVYQHWLRTGAERAFNGRYDTYYNHKRWGKGPRDCYNDRSNVIVSLTMVNRGGWGPWGG